METTTVEDALRKLVGMVSNVLTDSQLSHPQCATTIRDALSAAQIALGERLPEPDPAANEAARAQEARYIEDAREQYEEEGSIEIDRNAAVSSSGEDGDEGAYVAAWVWVDGTEYFAEEDDDGSPKVRTRD